MFNESRGAGRRVEKSNKGFREVRRAESRELGFHGQCNWDLDIVVEILDMEFELVEKGRGFLPDGAVVGFLGKYVVQVVGGGWTWSGSAYSTHGLFFCSVV